MPGCFGNSQEDRFYSGQLDDYLDTLVEDVENINACSDCEGELDSSLIDEEDGLSKCCWAMVIQPYMDDGEQ